MIAIAKCTASFENFLFQILQGANELSFKQSLKEVDLTFSVAGYYIIFFVVEKRSNF